MTQARFVASPNHGPRPAGTRIDMLVLHYTGMADAESALERLCDPSTAVSAHYLIDRDGATTALVREERRAWHAGVASWHGASDINDRSIGIELVNPGHQWGYLPFPPEQMTALAGLCRGIVARHPIPPRRILGHSDVAPLRKSDPGELFDWRGLARAGIGWWPDPEPVPDGWQPGPTAAMRQSLRRIGYACPDAGGALNDTDRAVLLAFQRRWMPQGLSGAWDGPTSHRVCQLIRLSGGSGGAGGHTGGGRYDDPSSMSASGSVIP